MRDFWNKLDRSKRFVLLTKASNYEKTFDIRSHECTLKWGNLLPSTRRELERYAAGLAPETKGGERRSRA